MNPKRQTYRFISLLMACLILMSSTGLVVDLHFCQNQLKSFSLIGKAKSCHAIAKKSCHKAKKSCHALASQQQIDGSCQKNCCSNKTVQIDHDKTHKVVDISSFSLENIEFIQTFIQVFFHQIIDENEDIIPHRNYIPPWLNKDIPILIQRLLL